MENKKLNFEQALLQLEDIVTELENNEIELNTAIKNYQKGIKLITICKQHIENAQLKVKEISDSNID